MDVLSMPLTSGADVFWTVGHMTPDLLATAVALVFLSLDKVFRHVLQLPLVLVVGHLDCSPLTSTVTKREKHSP